MFLSFKHPNSNKRFIIKAQGYVDTDSGISVPGFMTDLVEPFDKIWDGPKDSDNNLIVYAFDSNHNTVNSLRRYGWGQGQVQVKYGVPPEVNVSSSMVIEVEHFNTLVAQMNVAMLHIDSSDRNLLDNSVQAGTKIYASSSDDPSSQPVDYFDDARVALANKINNHRFETDGAKIYDALENNYQLPPEPVWSDDLQSEQVYTFNNYTHARHYFNSGGQLILRLDTTYTTNNDNQIAKSWDTMFADMGPIEISAERTRNTGVNPNANVVTNSGFYSLSYPSEYRTIFDINANNAHADEYSAYTGSIYSQRRVRVEAKGVETPTAFEVHVRVSLIEDIDDYWPVNIGIELDLGYREVDTVPDTANPLANLNLDTTRGQPGPKFFQFTNTHIPSPTIHILSPWTRIDI